MKPRRTLLIAAGVSCLVHAAIISAPAWDLPDPSGKALRLKLELVSQEKGARVFAQKPKSNRTKQNQRYPAAPSSTYKEKVQLAQANDSPPDPIVSDSAPAEVGASEPVAINTDVNDQSALSNAVQTASRDQEDPHPTLKPAAERLPRAGRVSYAGSASLLNVTGLVSWEHDGEHYKARLGAGVIGATTSFNYESSGRLLGTQLISETTQDNRRGKESRALIDNQGGIVRMQRGGDERERRISGLAVALSSLPQALACLDEQIEKAALFIVGDFWVEDTVVINRGVEGLRLPEVTIETRRFQSKINNGKTIDIWLAPAWNNAPARIRYDDGSIVIDLKAVEVEINGHFLLQSRTSSGE